MRKLFSSRWLPQWCRRTPPVVTPRAWLCSYPKSGRTWLRFILSNYMNQVYSLGVAVDLRTMFFIMPNGNQEPDRGLGAYRFATHRRMPLIAVSHAEFQDKFAGQPVVFLMRSVSDAIVSFYFHNSRQWTHFQGTLSDYLRDPEWGMKRLVNYMNSWASQISQLNAQVITYESLKHDTEHAVLQVIRFLQLPEDALALRRSIELASVDRMRDLEIKQPLPGHHYDPRDVNARRVRKARVGAGLEHLSPEDIAYIIAYCRDHFSAGTRELYDRYGVPVVASGDERVRTVSSFRNAA